MTVHSVGLEELTCLVVDDGGWDSRDLDIPDELVFRNDQAAAVFIAVQKEILEYWKAAKPESEDS